MQQDSPNLNTSRQWFQNVQAKLNAFTKANDKESPPEPAPEIPPPEPPELLLLALARLWHAERGQLHAFESCAQDGYSPEAFAALAAQFDIDAFFENRTTASLCEADLPAMVLTKEGAARLLIGRNDGAFLGYSTTRSYAIRHEALAAEEAGALFRLRARIEDPAFLDTDPALIINGDPLRGVIFDITTRRRRLLVQLLVAASFSNLMLLALPIYTGIVFDRVIPHSAFDTLWAVSIGVMLALLADLSMRFVRIKLQDALAAATSAAIQSSIVRRLVEIKMTSAPSSASSTMLRLREVDQLTQLAPQLLTGVLVDAPFLVFVFALIWLNGGIVVLAPIIGLAAVVGMHHLAHLAAEGEQSRSLRLSHLQTRQLIETVEGLETIKVTRSERRVLRRFEDALDEYVHASHVARLWLGFSAYANATVGQAMIVLVMLIGVYQVSNASMTVGGLSACALLVGRVILPMGQLVNVVHRLHQSRTTLKLLAEDTGDFIERAGDRSGAVSFPPAGALRIVDVSFSYPNQPVLQLENISLTISPGERVAIIGRSGSGKSSLMKLFVRLAEPTRGAVLVDEFDTRQYAPAALRRTLAYMGQTPGLIDDTLLANLTLGLSEIDRDRLAEISRLTGVSDFAARHPQGYGMMIGPRGEKLSGGERQSVALARLLLTDARTLILDEPTAAMDTMLEARLVRDLRTLIGKRTFIVATHRAPILELVDRIIWLEGGRICADGPRAEVLKRLSGAAA